MTKKKAQPQAAPVQQSQADALKKSFEDYVQQAEKVTVQDEKEYEAATALLLQIKDAAKRAEDEKNKVLKPLKQAYDAERNRWKPLETLFEKINNIVRPKMKKYLDDKEAAAKKQLEALNKKIANGQIKNEETIARKQDEIYSAVPATTVHTGTGASSARKVAKLVITNRDLIPDEFWVIDEVALRKAVVTQDRIVPGAEKQYENSIAII